MDFRLYKGGRWSDTLSGIVMGWNVRGGEGCGNSGGARTESLEVGYKDADVGLKAAGTCAGLGGEVLVALTTYYVDLV